MSDPTMVINVRISHKTLATLVEYYERGQLKFPSVSSVARAALEDLAKLVVAQGLSCEYDAHEALQRISHMHTQKSRAHVLRREMSKQLTITPPSAPPVVSQQELDNIMSNLASTVNNSRKGE